ncbi:MAG: hypothetical protein DRG78_18195 [Epsilonproteobacteria bacterium]|nr:MAG: hypothetical protein DRG78_18195 [Campylobacterota bacterium]
MSIKSLNCEEVNELSDIQEKKVVDSKGGNKSTDAKFVSCLQTHAKDKNGNVSEVNELKYIIDTYFKEHKDNPELYKALCKCCKEKEEPVSDLDKLINGNKTEREEFMECLELHEVNIVLEALSKL